jgi:hypothetical protein
MKIVFIMIVLLLSIQGCNRDWGSTDCCSNHKGVTMCYKSYGATHGHIMCKDGHTCSDECY